MAPLTSPKPKKTASSTMTNTTYVEANGISTIAAEASTTVYSRKLPSRGIDILNFIENGEKIVYGDR